MGFDYIFHNKLLDTSGFCRQPQQTEAYSRHIAAQSREAGRISYEIPH